MEKQLGSEYPEIKRAQFLKDNCDEMENIGYVREFTPEEMEAMKDNLADVSIELNDLEVEKKELVKSLNTSIKPKNERRKVILKHIREKSEFVHEDTFKFIDHDEDMVGYYNHAGILVSSRRANPEERQTKMFTLPKDGTND